MLRAIIGSGGGSTTAAAGTDANAIGAIPRWVKVGSALDYTQFSAAALLKTNTLFSAKAGTVVHEIKLKHSTAFAGPAITAVTAEVGIAGTTDKYLSAFNVLQAVAATTFGMADSMGSESHTAAVNVTITLRTVGANTAALTAGVLDVYALLSVAL